MSEQIQTAYDLPEGCYDAPLTLVHREFPMGELLRRYWHPVGLASDASRRPGAHSGHAGSGEFPRSAADAMLINRT
jgi:hypothetical protein